MLQSLLDDLIVFLVNFPFVFFAGVGYFCGGLLRNMGFIKVVVGFFLMPASIKFLMELDRMWMATIPFVLGALVGYWGLHQTRYRLLEAWGHLQGLKR